MIYKLENMTVYHGLLALQSIMLVHNDEDPGGSDDPD